MRADGDEPNQIIFFDTEFVEAGMSIYPVSIGMVRLDGHTFYSEIESPWREHASEWIMQNVAPHLTGELVRTPAEVREALIDFVGEQPTEFWAYFAAYDWVVLCQLMGRLVELPENWSRFVRDLAWLDPTRERIHKLKVKNPKPHHALYDAVELRERFLKLRAGN